MTDTPAPRKRFRIAIPINNVEACDSALLDHLEAMLPDLPPDMAVQTARDIDTQALVVTGSHPHGHAGAELFIRTLIALARPPRQDHP